MDEPMEHPERSESELDELLGAYALDAVTEEERRAVEEYLRVNPRARAEVTEHREVASLLAWSGTPAPDGLWDRIAAQLEEPPPAPSGELAKVLAFDARPERPVTRGRGGRRALPWLAGAAAAAAVVAAVLVVADRDDSSPLEAAVDAARDERGTRVATLVAADGRVGGEVILDPDGHGYLVADELPALPDDRTWQLWGVVDGEAISLGILGNAPEIELFTVEGPVTQLIVTNEVAGGVITNGNPDGAFGGALG